MTTFAGVQSLYESSWSLRLLQETQLPVPLELAESLKSQFQEQLSSEPRPEIQGFPGLQATLLAVQGLLALGVTPAPPSAWLDAAVTDDGRVAYSQQSTPTLAAASTYARIASLTGAEIPRAVIDDAALALQSPAISEQYLYETGIPALSILNDAGELPTADTALIRDWSSAIASAPPSPQGLTALERLQNISRKANGPTVDVAQAYVEPLRPPSGPGLTVAGKPPLDAQVTVAGHELGLIADASTAANEQLDLANPRGWSGRRSEPTLRSNYMAVTVLQACGQTTKPIDAWLHSWFTQNQNRRWTGEELYEFTFLIQKAGLELSSSDRDKIDQRSAEILQDARASQNLTELALALLAANPHTVNQSDTDILVSPTSTRQANLIWHFGEMVADDRLRNASVDFVKTMENGGAYKALEDSARSDLLSSAEAASIGIKLEDNLLGRFEANGLWVLDQSEKDAQPTNLIGIYSAVGIYQEGHSIKFLGVVG